MSCRISSACALNVTGLLNASPFINLNPYFECCAKTNPQPWSKDRQAAGRGSYSVASASGTYWLHRQHFRDILSTSVLVESVMPIVNCSQCNKPKHVKPFLATRSATFFCDDVCRSAYFHITVSCASCGKPKVIRRSYKTYGNYFCDMTCQYEFMRREATLTRYCDQCGLPVPRVAWMNKRKPHVFCNKVCYGQWRSYNCSGENHPRWKGGYEPYYGPNWYEQRAKARDRDQHLCQNCGKTEFDNGRALDVHHLRPFRLFKYIPGQNDHYLQANDLANLQSLCSTCHRTLEWKLQEPRSPHIASI